MLSKHYTSDIDLVDKDYSLAESHLYYFYTTIKNMSKFIQENNGNKNGEGVEDDISGNIILKFIEVMDDDFNTAAAIAELFGIFKYANGLFKKTNKKNREKIANTFAKIIANVKEVYSILGFFTQDPDEFITNMRNKYLKKLDMDVDYIKDQIQLRVQAKMEKDFEKADAIRSDLEAKGIILNDTPNGVVWDIKALYNVE